MEKEFSPQKFYECFLALERNFPTTSPQRQLLESTFSSVGGVKGAQRRLNQEVSKKRTVKST